MSRYSKLINIQTPFAQKMKQLSNRIFGEVYRPTNQTSMKVVSLTSEQPVRKNPERTADYYPRHVEINKLTAVLRDYGLFRDEHKDFQEEMIRLRELRGKRIWRKDK